MRQALAQDLPTVLLCHIPISLPTLRGVVMQAMDGNPILMADPDWAPELRIANFVDDTTPVTSEFVRLVNQAENRVAILTGHCHLPHVDAINPWAAQYLAPPGYAGQYAVRVAAAVSRQRLSPFQRSSPRRRVNGLCEARVDGS